MNRHVIVRILRQLALLHRLWQGFAFLTLLSCMHGTAWAQPDSSWSRTYGRYGDAWGISLRQTGDGGFITAGNILDGMDWNFWLLKTDANGDSEWCRSFGMGRYGGGGYVSMTADGGYILAGSYYAVPDRDMYLVRVSAAGDSLWSHRYRGSSDDYCRVAEQTSDGGFFLAGYRAANAQSQQGLLLKTDAQGDSLWSVLIGPGGFTDGHQTPDGGYILAGETSGSAPPSDFWLVKTDFVGNVLWQHTYGGVGDDYWPAIQLTADGGYVLVGTTASFGAGGQDVWVLRTDAQGDSLWSRTFGGAQTDRSHAVQLTADGGLVIGAHTNSFGAGSDDFWLIRTGANGDSLWSRTFGTANGEWCNDVAVTGDGGFAMFGGESLPGSHQQVYLVRTARDPSLSAPPSFFLPPSSITLSNYPNPFNSSTWITFDVPKSGNMAVKVYDVLGRQVAVLKDGQLPAGSHRMLFDGSGLASGVYVVRLEANETSRTQKVVLLK